LIFLSFLTLKICSKCEKISIAAFSTFFFFILSLKGRVNSYSSKGIRANKAQANKRDNAIHPKGFFVTDGSLLPSKGGFS
jgi:hypothetical protein